jgi:uncharacterized SAM-binding protein YcdF (DUF218 family)
VRSSEGPGRLHRTTVSAVAGGFSGLLLRDLLPLEMASAWIPFAIAGAIVGATALWRILPLLTLGVFGLWSIVTWTPLVATSTPWFVRADPPASADAVLVMGDRLQTDGQPSAAAQARILHGIELVRSGLAPRLILVGAPPGQDFARSARDQLARLRLEAEVDSLPGEPRSTHDEAVSATELSRSRGWRRLLVVTSPVHSRRACATVEHESLKEGIGIVCSPAEETEFDVEVFDRPLDRLAAFRQILHETMGICLYKLRGWIS